MAGKIIPVNRLPQPSFKTRSDLVDWQPLVARRDVENTAWLGVEERSIILNDGKRQLVRDPVPNPQKAGN